MKQNWWKAASVCLMMSLAGLCLTNCGSDDNGEPGNELPQTPKTPDMPQVNEFAQTIVKDMVMVTPGTFLMGSPDTDADALSYEKPQHEVTITRHYLIGIYEVTQQQYEDVMGEKPTPYHGPTRPLIWMSYDDIQEFLAKLNEKAGVQFRLPTEEEWEFAARGGQNSTWKYAGSNDVNEVAWHNGNSEGRSHSIEETLAAKKPNALGIYNMSGNVEEWTSTTWKRNYEPTTVETANSYAVRGGTFAHGETDSRVSQRHPHKHDEKWADLGLRLALSLE